MLSRARTSLGEHNFFGLRWIIEKFNELVAISLNFYQIFTQFTIIYTVSFNFQVKI